MAWIYLIGLGISFAGVMTLDWRYKLAWWRDSQHTARIVGVSFCIFFIWDVLGIWLGVFQHGGGAWTLPIRLFAEFPVEELIFLIFLPYLACVIYGGLVRWQPT